MWSKRVCGLILAAVMLFSSVPVAVHAEESPIEGYITVMVEGSSENYVCLKSNDMLFLSAEDLATISGYELSIGDHVAFSKAGGMDSVTAVDIQNDGTVSAMGKAYQLTVLNYQEKVYLPIANTLYLLHAQWSMEDGKLVVQPLPKTIIDFLGENNDAMWENKINQTDLLINGESELANILRSSLAAVFNDFDPMIFIFWWPGEGFTPALNDEFEEALLQIAVDDMDFLDTYGQQEISEMLQGSGFSQVKTSWGNIQSMLNLPDNLNLKDAVNKISEAADTNKSIKFNTYADISAIPLDQLEEWSNKMQPVTDVLTLLDYAIQVSEVATRSQQWGQDFLDQISVLTEFDDTGYNKMISDRVQLVANNLIKEYQDPIKSAVLEANEQAIALLLSEIWDVGPFGKFFALFNTGLAIAKTDENIKTSIDTADLSYMVDCLVKTEHIAMTEMNRSYMDLIDSRRTGSFTEDDLFRLRNCVILSLRTNMRNTAFLYYLNEQLTDDPIWESSAQARSLRQQIINDCALVCQLMETESYDRLLLLDNDFGNIYSDEYGEVRTEITAEIFTEGEMQTNNIEDKLIGTWSNDSYTVCFNRDGSGWERNSQSGTRTFCWLYFPNTSQIQLLFDNSDYAPVDDIYMEDEKLILNNRTVLIKVKENETVKADVSQMEITDYGSYMGNMGDSCMFSLNRDGLPGINNQYYNNGNIGLDGSVFQYGLEAWIARWNYQEESSWAYITYKLGKKYVELSCKTDLIQSYNATNFNSTLYFYSGDTLLASYVLTPDNYKYDFKVNVTGVDELKIMIKDNIPVSGGTSFALYDMFLS